MYLLVKGINGFGNMMSVLNTAYFLARESKRTLVIDWTHPEWKLGFDNYFDISGVKYMSLQDFYNKVLGKKLSIYPTFFENNLDKNLIDLKPNIDSSAEFSANFDSCIKFAQKKKYDIVIFSYNWLGYNGIKTLWANLKLKSDIKNIIDNKIKSLGEYKAIHIRQTDIKNINLNWAIEFLINNKNITVYLATDNKELLDKLKSQFPNIVNFTTYYDNKPLHSKDNSEEIKKQTNLDTITDMFILINGSELKITPIKTVPFMTTFSLLATALKN